MKIFASPADDGACGNYRVKQPLSVLGESGDHSVAFKDGTFENEEDAVAYMMQSNTFVFQRPKTEDQVAFFRQFTKDPRKLLVFEHDDNTWDLHPLSDHYRWHGTTDVTMPLKEAEKLGILEAVREEGKTIKDGQVWIWEHGKNRYDVNENARNRKNFETCLSLADVVTTTQPKLARLFEEKAKELGTDLTAHALPNCLDLRKWRPIEVKHEGIRILWQGGASHHPDLKVVEDALTEICKKFPQVTLVFGGTYYPGITSKVNTKQVEVYDDWVPWETHPYKMAFYGADINIVPIDDTYFNSFKSDLKVTEAGALGIPSVASNLTPYKESIEHGKNGLLADNTTESWVEHLSALVENATLRKTIGQAARKWVEENRDAKKEATKWADVYTKELKKKNDKFNATFKAADK